MNERKRPSVITYADVREWFDRALASEKGLIVECETHGAAVSLNQRLHRFRRQDREANAVVYEPGHPMHNSSVYDILFWPPPVNDETEVKIYKRTPEMFKTREIE